MVRTLIAAVAAIATLSSAPAFAQDVTVSNAPGRTDHDQVVGKLGLTYFGQFNVPLGADPSDDGVDTQLVGVRYWLNDNMGVDAAIGLGIFSGSTKSGGTSVDITTPTAFALAVGVPFKLFAGQHYTFFGEPLIDLGFASATDKSTSTTVDISGFRFAFGARAGAEIQFGFIGIPQLALDATLSLLGDVRTGSQQPSGGTEDSFSTFTLTTDTQNQPWNIFQGNVVVRYYF